MAGTLVGESIDEMLAAATSCSTRREHGRAHAKPGRPLASGRAGVGMTLVGAPPAGPGIVAGSRQSQCVSRCPSAAGNVATRGLASAPPASAPPHRVPVRRERLPLPQAALAAVSSDSRSTAEEKAAFAGADESTGEGCTKCRLYETRTHTVFGEGDPDAKIFFIGEGPGETEDHTGRPFVGRAGELLNKQIAAMGLRREQVFIANIVKCRPPDNRVPAPDEVATARHICSGNWRSFGRR